MASIKIVHYTSKTLKNGEHPLMLRIIKDRQIKYISLGFSASVDHYDTAENKLTRKYPNYKKINHFLEKKRLEAESIILDFENSGKSYSLEEFDKKFIGGIKRKTVFEYFDEIIDRLEKTGRIGNANVHKDTKRAIKKFRNNKDLEFSDITYSFLKLFEEDFLKRGVLPNSIGVYMRALRSVFNRAIAEGYCKESEYPFKQYKVSSLKSTTPKRAIPKNEIHKVAVLEIEPNTALWHSKNYFLFSYYSRGINFTDIAFLKWSNIVNNRLDYIRAKTKKHYSIALLEPASQMLNLYKKPNSSPEDYIFPILSNTHVTKKMIDNRIKKVRKQHNYNLKEIAASVGITIKLTTYVARHSWAMAMKKAGVPIAVISEGMGHDSEKTTKIYLESFENSILDEASKSVL